MSDPNLNDAVEPTAGAFESAEAEAEIVEAADAVEPDQAEAADADAAGEPAEQAAVNVEDEAAEGDDEIEEEAELGRSGRRRHRSA